MASTDAGKMRRATFSDLKDIVDINDDVYEGFDYFPAMFYVFMQSKRHAIYVYERNGRLLGLFNLKFHPEENDLATRMSGRIHSSVLGQGLTRDDGPIIKQITTDYPNITRFLADTLLKPNIQAKLQQFKKPFIWNFLIYKSSDNQQLRSFTRFNQPLKPIRLSYDSAIEWLQTGNKQLEILLLSYSTEFIPVFGNWEPVRISKEGLKYLFSNNLSFVSFGDKYGGNSNEDKTQATVVIPQEVADDLSLPAAEAAASLIRKAQQYKISGLSYSSCVPVKHGLKVDIYFYGDSDDLFLSHLHCHVGHYLDLTTDQVKVGFVLHFPLTIRSEKIESRLLEEWGERVANNYYTVTQAVQYIESLSKL